MVFNRKNKKEVNAIEDLVAAKVYVTPDRLQELIQLKEKAWRDPLEEPEPEEPEPLNNMEGQGENEETPLVPAAVVLLCINLSEGILDALRRLPGFEVQAEQFFDGEDKDDKDKKKKDNARFLKLFAGKNVEKVGAVIHNLHSQGGEEDLDLFDKRVIALSLLNKLPVLCTSRTGADSLTLAAAYTGHTWPVYLIPHDEHAGPLCEWVADELPRVRRLSCAIRDDLLARTAHLGKINIPWHFVSRASVALVPGGVAAVNFLGILRVMSELLKVVGMRGDTSANKSLSLLGAENAVAVTAIDSLGDVYSLAIFSTVLADLQALGAIEALAALSALDTLALGSISLVTGTVSAIGAALSRPQMVRAAAQFLAGLQLMYVLNPAMRRDGPRKKKKGKKGKKGKGAGKDGQAEGAGEGEAEGEGEGEGDASEEAALLRGELMQRSAVVIREGGRRQAEAALEKVAKAEAAAVKRAAKVKKGKGAPAGEDAAGAGGEGEQDGEGGARRLSGASAGSSAGWAGGDEGLPPLPVSTGVGQAAPSGRLFGEEHEGDDGVAHTVRELDLEALPARKLSAADKKLQAAAAKAAKEAEKARVKEAKEAAVSAKVAEKEARLREKALADAREKAAKAAEKAAKAEGKEEQKAARLAEKEAEKARKEAEKEAERARKEEERAAKAAAKLAAKEAKLAAKEASRSGWSATCGPEASPHSLPSAGAAGVEGHGAAGADGGVVQGMLRASQAFRRYQDADDARPSSPGGGASTSNSGAGGSGCGRSSTDEAEEEGGGWDEQAEVELAERESLLAAVERDKRMGLDERAMEGLWQFLALDDAQVLVGSEAEAATGSAVGAGLAGGSGQPGAHWERF